MQKNYNKMEVNMRSVNIVTLKNPMSPISEAYRILRTNIQFSSPDKKLQSILITSSGPSEGKSTTSVNLAVSLAQTGNRVIIVDCDQRKPNVHKLFTISNITGLSNLLVGEATVDEAIIDSGVENLYILPAGRRPPNPSELLASEKMKTLLETLRETFDYIILDTPPVIMVTDAQLLSKYADGCILVVASGQADREAAVKAKELLENANAKILGIVLNKLDTKRRGYYGYYSENYYGDDGHNKRKRNRR